MTGHLYTENYSVGELDQVAGEIVILTGVTRSGTTITGKLFSTFTSVEYEYEPWIARSIPIIAQAGLLDQEFGSKLLRKFANELMVTRLLGRNVNLRPSDSSYILSVLSQDELEYRWEQLSERKDAIQYAKKRRSIFMMKMTNMPSYYEFFQRSFLNLKLIHVVRNGLDVALSISKKAGWYTDERLRTSEGFNLSKVVTNKKTGAEYVVPFHIPPEEAETFSQLTPFARGLHSWCIVMEQHQTEQKRLALNSKNYFEFKYEDLLKTPDSVVKAVSDFVGTTKSPFTDQILRSLKKEKLSVTPDYPLQEVPFSLAKRAALLFRQFGYDTQKFDPVLKQGTGIRPQ